MGEDKTEIYPKGILRSIDYEQSELDKITDYIMKILCEKKVDNTGYNSLWH
jgi:hypothetical protein